MLTQQFEFTNKNGKTVYVLYDENGEKIYNVCDDGTTYMIDDFKNAIVYQLDYMIKMQACDIIFSNDIFNVVKQTYLNEVENALTQQCYKNSIKILVSLYDEFE